MLPFRRRRRAAFLLPAAQSSIGLRGGVPASTPLAPQHRLVSCADPLPGRSPFASSASSTRGLKSPRPGVRLELDFSVTSAVPPGRPRPDRSRFGVSLASRRGSAGSGDFSPAEAGSTPPSALQMPRSAQAASTDRSRRQLPSLPETLHTRPFTLHQPKPPRRSLPSHEDPLETCALLRPKPSQSACPSRGGPSKPSRRAPKAAPFCPFRPWPTHPQPSPLARLQPPIRQPAPELPRSAARKPQARSL